VKLHHVHREKQELLSDGTIEALGTLHTAAETLDNFGHDRSPSEHTN
jgi:hypothetical protein